MYFCPAMSSGPLASKIWYPRDCSSAPTSRASEFLPTRDFADDEHGTRRHGA